MPADSSLQIIKTLSFEICKLLRISQLRFLLKQVQHFALKLPGSVLSQNWHSKVEIVDIPKGLKDHCVED